VRRTPHSPAAMSRRYDSRTTIFSPEGRLYQVEYAMEALGHAGSAVGICTGEGIVLAAEKKVTSKLLEPLKTSEKMYKIDSHISAAVAGITADANVLVNYARTASQRYYFTYQEPMPVEQLVQVICDMNQGYTQFGGQRPFGVSALYAGWDKKFGFQLLQSDPSGNYNGWKASAIGQNSSAAQGLLKQEYDDGMTLAKGKALALKCMTKTMNNTSLTPERLEFAIFFREGDEVVYRSLRDDEVKALISEHEETAQAEGMDE